MRHFMNMQMRTLNGRGMEGYIYNAECNPDVIGGILK